MQVLAHPQMLNLMFLAHGPRLGLVLVSRFLRVLHVTGPRPGRARV